MSRFIKCGKQLININFVKRVYVTKRKDSTVPIINIIVQNSTQTALSINNLNWNDKVKHHNSDEHYKCFYNEYALTDLPDVFSNKYVIEENSDEEKEL
jgi:hypothetical protein